MGKPAVPPDVSVDIAVDVNGEEVSLLPPDDQTTRLGAWNDDGQLLFIADIPLVSPFEFNDEPIEPAKFEGVFVALHQPKEDE